MKSQTITELNSTNFREILQNSKVPVLVDFWAEWCAPCRMLTPVLETLADEMEESILVAKLNVDENPEVARELGIVSIPTVKGFKNGKEVFQSIGAAPLEYWKSAISQFA